MVRVFLAPVEKDLINRVQRERRGYTAETGGNNFRVFLMPLLFRPARFATMVSLRLARECDAASRVLFQEGGTYTPHSMHEIENKRVAKWVPRKFMKRKGRFFLGWGRGKTQNGNGNKSSCQGSLAEGEAHFFTG